VRSSLRAATLLTIVTACGGGASDRDSSGAASSGATAAAAGAADSAAAPTYAVAPGVYVDSGACPFECCRYGDWTMRTGAVLRSDLSDAADSIGALHAGDKVRADSGIVVLRPMGLAVVTDTAIDFHGNAHPPMRVGDTLYLLDYHGEGYRSVRLHDSVFSMAEEWNATGTTGVRLVRKPVSFWWVHMTKGEMKGWVNMSGVQVGGADACGGTN